MSGPPLSVEDLCVTYANGHRALTDVSLMVEHGERLAVVGVSGSGKTTLVRAIMGLLPATATVTGRIRVEHHDLLTMTPRARRELNGRAIGFVAQDPFAAFDPLRRVRQHVEEPFRAHGERVPAGYVETGLAAMGIPDPHRRSRQRPHQWSGGMLQRATTLAATVHDPVLTVADEPTSALDTELADGTLELLRSTCSALVVVTHDLALAARHTDRIAVFHDGRVIEQGPATTIVTTPTHAVTRALVDAATPLPRRTTSTLTAASALVRADEITKSYATRHGTVTAVHATSLDVHAGEVVGIIGPSGSGKSTLLRLLTGMERPDAGTLLAQGRPMWPTSRPTPDLPRKGFAMPVFQDPVGSLDARWPLWRTITEPIVLAGTQMHKHERRAHASAALATLGLGDIDVDRLPGSLSVGQCQRVAVLRALSASPALVAADEPTASLDVEVAKTVSDMLRAAADAGTAVVVVSHDEARVRSYADRVLTMRDGVVHPDGDLA